MICVIKIIKSSGQRANTSVVALVRLSHYPLSSATLSPCPALVLLLPCLPASFSYPSNPNPNPQSPAPPNRNETKRNEPNATQLYTGEFHLTLVICNRHSALCTLHSAPCTPDALPAHRPITVLGQMPSSFLNNHASSSLCTMPLP